MANNNDGESTAIYNVTLVGLYSAGKTSIVNKLRENRFVKSYKPSEDKKILKYTLKQTVNELENKTVKLSFKDAAGLVCTHSNDESFLQRKSHILCFVYDHDNIDSYQCIKYLLENNDILFSTNRVIMVIRNKVDNKQMIAASQAQCDEQFKEITSINDEIWFIKNFSAKSKSQDRIEKMFIKAIELYREYYGNQPPPGAKKKKLSKPDAYVGSLIHSELKNTAKKAVDDDKRARNKKKTKQRARKKREQDSKGKYERTDNMNSNEGQIETNGAQCACVVL